MSNLDSIEQVNEQAIQHIEGLCRKVIEDGLKQGDYFSSPTTETGHEMNLRTARWKNYSTGETGEGFVSLFANVRELSLSTAASIVKTILGNPEFRTPQGNPPLPASLPEVAKEIHQSPTERGGNDKLRDTLNRTQEFLERYVIFKDKHQAPVIAIWAAHTYCYNAFTHTPYLSIQSPEKQSGKTTLMDAIGKLVANPLPTQGATSAAIYRSIALKPITLLFDEIDTVFSGNGNEELRGVLNSGYRKGGQVTKCVGDEHEPKSFSTFCPKALAGIGKVLPATVADRSIPIILTRKNKEQKVEPFRDRTAAEAAEPITKAFQEWSGDPLVIQALEDARPDAPEGFGNRQADVCEPLLAIADIAGGGWPERIRNGLVAAFQSIKSDEKEYGPQALSDIRDIFNEGGLNRIKSSELIQKMIDIDTSPWAELWANEWRYKDNKTGVFSKLARLLKPYGISSKTLHFSDRSDAKGYEETDFMDAWERYL
jgi:hypothetical protein